VPNVSLEGVYASDADHAWVVGDGKLPRYRLGVVARTTDGGATWEPKRYTFRRAGKAELYLITIHGVDANTVWAVGHDQAIHTADGGLTWVDQTPEGYGLFDLNGVFAVDRNTVWVVTDLGGIYRSDDGGAHWQKQSPPQAAIDDWILRISAVDAQTAWATTKPDRPPYPGHVLHTSDGGQTWIAQTTPVAPTFWGVSFVR
jgi:photosystem II stability/assembly factor-like uncharacterized protein